MYYRNEGFCTLMGHYASMYSLYLDTNIKPIIPTDNEDPNSPFYCNALKFFNSQYSDALEHKDTFPELNKHFEFLPGSILQNMDWKQANFMYKTYDEIIDIIINNSEINIMLQWSLSSNLYISHMQDILRLYTFDRKLQENCKNKLYTTNRTIVGVCVRTEYSKISCPHILLDIEYYKKAMDIFSCYNPKFLIFSDDINQSRKILAPLDNIYDIEYTQNMSSAKGLCLLSLCDHIINANSSFSYWASLLNSNPSKKIICPAEFIDPQKNKYLADELNNNWFPMDWIPIKVI